MKGLRSHLIINICRGCYYKKRHKSQFRQYMSIGMSLGMSLGQILYKSKIVSEYKGWMRNWTQRDHEKDCFQSFQVRNQSKFSPHTYK